MDGTTDDKKAEEMKEYIDDSINEMRASLLKDFALMLQQQRNQTLLEISNMIKSIPHCPHSPPSTNSNLEQQM